MTSTTTVLILNGPNLNMLGTREPEIYGTTSLGDIEAACRKHAAGLGMDIDFRQSNSESELIGWVQAAGDGIRGLIINAGAYTHTSIALLDALRTISQPIIEVHLSNIFRREAFRRHSFVAEAATGVICGLGAAGYLLALDAIDSEAKAREAT
ncbi:MAG: type II 3-dehydroquinate dehydratase [Alphaproteobacteria bacterium]|nr:MAG: type II 3-dehydroquinate dehydratase [Alphaproteobacteria bacterium]